jgi:sarcosine oxidase delta subunit
LIDVETGDYSEFKMNVDASINRCQDYTVWQKKGIDDYFYSLVRLKNKQQRKN